MVRAGRSRVERSSVASLESYRLWNGCGADWGTDCIFYVLEICLDVSPEYVSEIMAYVLAHVESVELPHVVNIQPAHV